MSQLLKSGLRILIRGIISIVLLCLLGLFSFYTPIFSSVGLFILNHLPISPVDHTSSSVFSHLNPMDNDSPDSHLEPNHLEPSHSEPTHIALDLKLSHRPTAYVVLGGGLTESDTYNEPQPNSGNQPLSGSSQFKNGDDLKVISGKRITQTQNHPAPMNNIVLNDYSLIRMQTVMWYQKQNPLPIILTGVEAPWMHDWLSNYGIDNIITENASMNTCENARFTAKRLNLSDVYLITDAYHMTRARRQFALNGIHTTPIAADLPMQKSWLKPLNNAQHSRRTIYELAAYARDVLRPQKNCRNANEVSFDTLMRSRKPKDVKTF